MRITNNVSALLVLFNIISNVYSYTSLIGHSQRHRQSKLHRKQPTSTAGHIQFTTTTILKDSFIDEDNIIVNANLSNLSFYNIHKSNTATNNNNNKKKKQNRSTTTSTSLSSAATLFNSNGHSHEQEHDDILEFSRRRVNNRHSANDWLHNIASIPKSTVLKDIRNPLLCVASWSTSISILHHLLSHSANMAHLATKMCIGTQMHSLMISSLGLLLVFRTNSAYQRFVEGRKIWEQILGIARNLDRMTSLYSKEIGIAKLHRIKHYLASFPYLLRHHIRPRCIGCDDTTPDQFKVRMEEMPYDVVETRHEGDTTSGGITNDVNADDILFQRPHYCWIDRRSLPWSLLDDKTLKRCANAINRPLWACNSIADELITIPYGPNFTSRERLSMIAQVDRLSNAIGQCERIHQTSVPLNYARHALRSLSIWLFTLPFALVKDLGLLTGPICIITAWLMFGVYQIGHSIEDPFQKTLRLSMLCNAIRRDVLGENKYKPSFGNDSINNNIDELDCGIDCQMGGISSATEWTEDVSSYSSEKHFNPASFVNESSSENTDIFEPTYVYASSE